MHIGDDEQKLKLLGYTLVTKLEQLLQSQNTWKMFADATSVATAAVGFLPIGDGPNHLSDDRVRASIPRVKGMVDLVEALLDFREGQPRAKAVTALVEALLGSMKSR